ncbi:Prickle-like protein 4 [Aix galericulata]|nr:Prickle-like protein 4 [Aix galericulata]
MSLPSPAWPQPDEPPPCGTATGLPPASSDSDSGCALEEYLEPPADPAPPEVPACFESRSLDPASPADRSRLRVKALLQQLPPQDCDERYCPGLAEEERKQLRAFSARRRREALGQGQECPVPGPCHGCPCKECGRRLNKGDPGISASRLGDHFWHPSCFSCHFCRQPLVDLIYFQQDGRIYCGRHHAELFRPRCASCDQLIFMEECIEAEGRRWHPEHFCCLECEEPLRGQRYVMRSGRPCCRGCFDSLFAEPCQACGDPIGTRLMDFFGGGGGGESPSLTRGHPSGVDSEEATHQGLHWHARAPCFCCSLCRKLLRGQPLTARHGRLFCSESCSLGLDAASSASDSSDSAFVSAPSPDSTPLSRAGHAARPGSALRGSEWQRGEGGGRDPSAVLAGRWEGGGSKARLRSAAAEPRGAFGARGVSAAPIGAVAAVGAAETSPDQASLHPAFRSLQDHEAATERSRDAAHAGTQGPGGSPQPGTEGPKGLGAPGPPISGDPGARTPAGDGNPALPAGLSPALHGTRPEDTDLQDITEEDDSWCPTCSSSSDSDSEEEGFFFGKPIPKPGMSSLGREPPERAGGRTAKPRGSSKHCSVS